MRSHQMYIDGEFEAPVYTDPETRRSWCAACKKTAETLAFISPTIIYSADPVTWKGGAVTVNPCGHRFESGSVGWILQDGNVVA